MRRRRRSFAAAWAGILHAVRTQPNFRIQLGAAAGAVALAAALRAPLAPILLASSLVLALEAVNTAVESAVDLACPEPHPAARAAKDCAAGAVLIAAVGAVAVGVVTLGPPLLHVARGGS